VAYVNIIIPTAMSESQLEYCAAVLELSDAQRLRLHSLYREYLDDDRELRQRLVKPLWERSAEIQQRSVPGRVLLDSAEEIEAVMRDRDQALAVVYARERRLFADLAQYLTEDQVAMLDRAIERRIRQRCRETKGKYPASNIDLSETLHRLRAAGHKMSVFDSAGYGKCMRTYESRATQLYQIASKRRLEAMVKGNLLYGRMDSVLQSERAPETIERHRAELAEEFFSLNERLLKANRAIHDLNRDTVESLVAVLSEEAADVLQQWFQERTYEAVYPNPYDATELLTAAVQLSSLDEAQSNLLRVVLDDYCRQRDKVSQKMEEEELAWWSHVESRSGYELGVYDEYQVRMGTLQNERSRIAERALATVESVLDEEERAEVSEILQRYSQQVRRFEQRREDAAKAGTGWPHPYNN